MDASVASRSFDSNMTASGIIKKGPHITRVPLESISELAPFSALILSIIFVFYFAIRFYILEGFLLKRLYGKTYTSMDEVTRRGFVNHHIAGGTKILILIVAAYPFIDCAFGNSTFHSSFAGSKHVTQGDVLLVVSQMLMAMYVFELFYRPKISPVSVGHHIGTIMIGQSAIAISLDLIHEKDATIEYTICLVWGKPLQKSSPLTPLSGSHRLTIGVSQVPSTSSLNFCLISRSSSTVFTLPRTSFCASSSEWQPSRLLLELWQRRYSQCICLAPYGNVGPWPSR